MNAALELVDLLESLERAGFPWSHAVGAQARRLRRARGCTVDNTLYKLEGLAEVIEFTGLADRDTCQRLGDLVHRAWLLQLDHEWPELPASPDTIPTPASPAEEARP